MMIVTFEVTVHEHGMDGYLSEARRLQPTVDAVRGFVDVQRYRSLSSPQRLLSLSLWSDVEAIDRWRRDADHVRAQSMGRHHHFAGYRITVAQVIRQYEFGERAARDTV
jgi:heme-degrading monooxygenase HmoA